MELRDEVFGSINNYFSALSHLGYKPYSEVNNLLVFSFIEEMLYGPLSIFITEEDYKHINKALECMYGSCMIPYPSYKKSYDSVVDKMPDEYRVIETKVLRSTDEDNLRIKS